MVAQGDRRWLGVGVSFSFLDFVVGRRRRDFVVVVWLGVEVQPGADRPVHHHRHLIGAEPAGAVADLEGDHVIALAERDAWFHYPYWLEESAAPDFAPTVDIHRKPGYDPCELFTDPKLAVPALRVARRLAQKKLGFRTLMDVVSQDPNQVRGSHGLLPETPEHGPLFLCSEPFSACGGDPEGSVEWSSFRERALALMELG